MFRNSVLLIAIVMVLEHPEATASEDPGLVRVGVGTAVITPQQSMWMAGYANRNRPSEGKVQELYAKTLAFEDATGAKFVLVTADVIGFPRKISMEISSRARDEFGIPRERIMITASHTHSGPVFRDNLIGMYDLNDQQIALVKDYTDRLTGLVVKSIKKSLEDLEPARLSWGVGEATFAKNRRKYTLGGVSNDFNPIGPVDHDVPVLKVQRPDGSLKAVAMGYACHNTTLDFYQFCGDYAGFAQQYLEDELPGATALFAAGCGGDQNPLPRGTLAHARKYGRELADAVHAVLKSPMSEVKGPIQAEYEEISLPLSEPPTREEVLEQTESRDFHIRTRAKMLLRTIDEKGRLETTYPYPIQVWKFGDSLQITALGGEVVVDYSLLLKHYLGGENHWVIAYANDVMAYIPSLRVLREGGYEGESAMIYYGLYGPWAPEVEEKIISAVHRISGKPWSGN